MHIVHAHVSSYAVPAVLNYKYLVSDLKIRKSTKARRHVIHRSSRLRVFAYKKSLLVSVQSLFRVSCVSLTT